MIRPLTIATFLLAGGSGLYLYQSKHEVQLLDRTIERTVHDTGTLREQSRLLAAEWTMLNDPERLRQFSDTYLTLHTISPTQFTSLADLGNRLPAPRADDVPHPADEPLVVAPPAEMAPVSELAPAADETIPRPPLPTPRPAVALTAVPHTADARPVVSRPVALEHQPRQADARSHEQRLADQQRPAEQRPPEQRPFEQRPTPRLADARPPVGAPPSQVAYAPARPPLPAAGPVSGPPPIMAYRSDVPSAPYPVAAQPYSGSLLGAARGSMPPAPRPTPVNATYNAN